jgi:hypothetical protein
MKDTCYSPERGIGLLGAPDSIKVTKEFICAVEEMNNHCSQDPSRTLKKQ